MSAENIQTFAITIQEPSEQLTPEARKKVQEAMHQYLTVLNTLISTMGHGEVTIQETSSHIPDSAEEFPFPVLLLSVGESEQFVPQTLEKSLAQHVENALRTENVRIKIMPTFSVLENEPEPQNS